MNCQAKISPLRVKFKYYFLAALCLLLFPNLPGCSHRSGQMNLPSPLAAPCASPPTIVVSNSSPTIDLGGEAEITITLSCFNAKNSAPQIVAQVEEESQDYLALVDGSGNSHSSLATLGGAGSGNTFSTSFRFQALKSWDQHPKVNFTLSGNDGVRSDLVFEILAGSNPRPSALTVEPFQESKNGKVSVNCGNGAVLRWKSTGEGVETIPAFRISYSKASPKSGSGSGNSPIQTIDVRRSDVEVAPGAGTFAYSFDGNSISLLENGNLLSYQFEVRACRDFEKDCNESITASIDSDDVFDPFHQCESHKRSIAVDFGKSVQGRILMTANDTRVEFSPLESGSPAYFNAGAAIDLRIIPFVGSTLLAIQRSETSASLIETLDCQKGTDSTLKCSKPLELKDDLYLTVRGDRAGSKGDFKLAKVAISKIAAKSASLSGSVAASKKIDVLEYRFQYWRYGDKDNHATKTRKAKSISKDEKRFLTTEIEKLKSGSRYRGYLSVRVKDNGWVDGDIFEFTTGTD